MRTLAWGLWVVFIFVAWVYCLYRFFDAWDKHDLVNLVGFGFLVFGSSTATAARHR